MSDYLQRYLPEYDEDAERGKLQGFSHDGLIELLILAYKERRVLAKLLDEERGRMQRLRSVLDEPSQVAAMPAVPEADDLRRLMER